MHSSIHLVIHILISIVIINTVNMPYIDEIFMTAPCMLTVHSPSVTITLLRVLSNIVKSAYRVYA